MFSNLFVGLFPQKAFHIPLVDDRVLFLRFLGGLIDWTETRFKIVINVAYDVMSWSCLDSLLAIYYHIRFLKLWAIKYILKEVEAIISGLLSSTRPTWGLLAEASRSARIVGAWTSILRRRSKARASTGRHSTLKAVCVGGLASRISASERSFRNKFVHVPMSIKCLAWCIRIAFRSEPFEQHESYSLFILLTGVATGVARRLTGDSAKAGRHTSVTNF